MSQRTLEGTGIVLFILALITMLAGGHLPAVNANRQVVAPLPPEDWSAGNDVPTRPTSQPLSVSPHLARPMATPSPSPAVPATPTSIPVYVPLSDPPTPLVAADLCAETRGQISVDHFYSESLGRKLRYRLYLPPCYGEAGRLFPVLYMFHGLNYGDSQWDVIGLDERVDAGIAAGELPPLIIVMPNIWGIDRNPDGGTGSVEEAVVSDLLPFVEQTYCAWGDRQGRAIGGLSRGAFWALEIAFRHPELFASVGGHSPAVFWDNAAPEYNPYYLADDAPGLESLRIRLDLGEDDWLNKWIVQFRERLDERGLAYAFSTAPGDHDITYWRSQLDAYLEFYTGIWPTDWRELPSPLDCVAQPGAPGCRNGLGLGRPCDISLP
jgi:enterochelin esterase-like enzyme